MLDSRGGLRAQAQAERKSADPLIGLAPCVGLSGRSERRAARQAQEEKASAELLSPSPGLQTPQVRSGLWPGPAARESFGLSVPIPTPLGLSGPCRAVRVSAGGGRCQVAPSSGCPGCEGIHLSSGTPLAVPSSCDLSSSGSSSGHRISVCLPSLSFLFAFRSISNPEAGF